MTNWHHTCVPKIASHFFSGDLVIVLYFSHTCSKILPYFACWFADFYQSCIFNHILLYVQFVLRHRYDDLSYSISDNSETRPWGYYYCRRLNVANKNYLKAFHLSWHDEVIENLPPRANCMQHSSAICHHRTVVQRARFAYVQKPAAQ